MKSDYNEKGFTLVEVVVSIAVGSIVLGLILSVLLTSFDLYGDYASTDQRKLSTDNIMDYIHSTISNATDLRIKKLGGRDSIVSSAPSMKLNEKVNWHYMYVNSKGRLVVDGKVMFDGDQINAYYGSEQSKFSLSYTVAKKNDSNFYTLNLTGDLTNNDKDSKGDGKGSDRYKGKYSKTDAILLSSLPNSYENLPDENQGKLQVSTTEKNINRTNILYFANENILNAQESVEPTYTIADKLNLLSDNKRNKSAFQASKIRDYVPGDIVTYNGFTYMRTASHNTDFYTRDEKNADIKKFNNYYILHIFNPWGSDSLDLYVPSDYVSTSNGGKNYSLNWKENIIKGVVVSPESKSYLETYPNLDSQSTYFDVVYYFTRNDPKAGSNYRGLIMLTPGACVKMSDGTYTYAGWERLSTTSVMNSPTSTPAAAQYDPNSIYLPGDLFVYKDNLYEVLQMSSGTTAEEGHKVIDNNGNPIDIAYSSLTKNYGSNKGNTTGKVVQKIGNYNKILDDIENNSNGYMFWMPNNTGISVTNGFEANSGVKYNSDSYATKVNLTQWAYTSNGSKNLTGDFAQLPTYNS